MSSMVCHAAEPCLEAQLSAYVSSQITFPFFFHLPRQHQASGARRLSELASCGALVCEQVPGHTEGALESLRPFLWLQSESLGASNIWSHVTPEPTTTSQDRTAATTRVADVHGGVQGR